MNNLRVTLIQTALRWEDAAGNIELFDEKIRGVDQETDLIVLPEMFTTGFSMNAEPLAQAMDGGAVTWMKNLAKEKRFDIVGGLIIREGGKFYNRLVWAQANGEVLYYDKRHLFRIAGEEKVYCAGKGRLTVGLKEWKIRPLICYDLRFPVWSRNIDNQYDLAIFIANWPDKRIFHWNVLLQARAIENQAFVVGLNRVGRDGNGHTYCGDSCVIDPRGEKLFHERDVSCVHTEELSAEKLLDYRKKFPFRIDADEFDLSA